MSDYTQEALLALELARVRAERDAAVEREHALARKLALIELAWDRCEGVPNRADMGELHQLIINTEPHVDDLLTELRHQSVGDDQ